MMKVIRDEKDFIEYGGDIPPNLDAKCSNTFNNTATNKPISEREHRAELFDFAATKTKWANNDLTGTLLYKSLSNGFQRAIGTAPNVVTYSAKIYLRCRPLMRDCQWWGIEDLCQE